MVQIILRVIDIDTGQGIGSALVKGSGQGHGGILGNTYAISFSDYTNNEGRIYVDADFSDNYDISVVITASGYHALTEAFTTGGMTGNFYKTFSLTPHSQAAPPGQGSQALFTGTLAGLSDLIAGQSGAMGPEFAIILIAIAIIAIAIVIIILRFG